MTSPTDKRSILSFAAIVPLVAGCAADASRQAPTASNLPFTVQVVADFESPWAMTFLPDGRMLITTTANPFPITTRVPISRSRR